MLANRKKPTRQSTKQPMRGVESSTKKDVVVRIQIVRGVIVLRVLFPPLEERNTNNTLGYTVID